MNTQEKIDKNRDLINRLLHSELPLAFINDSIKVLSDKNIELIKQLNNE